MKPLVYLSPVAWHGLWQRPQRLALALAHENAITYVDPIGMRSLRWSDWRRVFERIQSPLHERRSLPVVRLKYLPWQSASIDAWNRRWLIAQLRRAAPEMFQQDITLWIGAPSLLALAILDAVRPSRAVYDCMDHFAGFHQGAARRRIESAEAEILSRAHLVLASSRPLARTLSARHARVMLAPNGVDVEHFAAAQASRAPGRRPRIGFHGTLGPWLDYALIATLARARPEWEWELIGPSSAPEAKRLAPIPNLRCSPPVPYEELPARLATFDVGVIPFVRNALTEAAHPVKLGEYLAAGLPVVATRLASIAPVSGQIQLAQSAEEWLKALDSAVVPEAHAPQRLRERHALAATHSWRRTSEIILAALRDLDETPAQHAPHETRNSYRPAA